MFRRSPIKKLNIVATAIAVCIGLNQANAEDLQTQKATHFNHPGVRVNLAQLEHIRQAINSNTAPIALAYQAALKSPLASLQYKPNALPPGGIIECGSYSKPNIGCSNEDEDATAAYLQALLWYATGNKTYAENAITIMNAYAYHLKGHTNSNAPLQAAWTAEKWPAAAEIIRYTYDGWQANDIAQFQQMLTTQYLPLVNGTNGYDKNGNWELSMIDATMGIAVFNDDRNLYSQAVELWKKWVPAYFYNQASDGSSPVTFSNGPRGETAFWNGQTVFNAKTSGVSQETCRDMGHMQLGLAATISAAETAYLQGDDLYTESQARLTTALEYHARLLLGTRNTSPSDSVNVPSGFPGLCNGKFTPILADTMEIGYNAYHTRMGIALPETEKHLLQDVRPAASPSNNHNIVWETLTHGS